MSSRFHGPTCGHSTRPGPPRRVGSATGDGRVRGEGGHGLVVGGRRGGDCGALPCVG
ncbi:hypothetical protein HMPREF1980_00785 [Actinomyces sp. oral taxon 172 str. F0311]|nr:hypothetical protein HMPREF1980_00785 [Actinomyces sp. oral taxon 172 str. F0311]